MKRLTFLVAAMLCACAVPPPPIVVPPRPPTPAPVVPTTAGPLAAARALEVRAATEAVTEADLDAALLVRVPPPAYALPNGDRVVSWAAADGDAILAVRVLFRGGRAVPPFVVE